MPVYKVYGIRVATEFALNLRRTRSRHFDLKLELGGPLNSRQLPSKLKISTRGSASSLNLPGVGSCIYRKGRLSVRLSRGLSSAAAHSAIVNQMIPFALCCHGELLFHGSAVANENGAILFLGRRGLGKSNLAARLMERGYHLLADDVVRVDLHQRQIYVHASVPEVRLFPKDIRHYQSPHARDLVSGKARLDARRFFATRAFPLGKIVVLQARKRAGRLEWRELDGAGRYPALMTNLFYFNGGGREFAQLRFERLLELCRRRSVVAMTNVHKRKWTPELSRLIRT